MTQGSRAFCTHQSLFLLLVSQTYNFLDFDNSDSIFYGDPVWLERMVQALMSCVTTGNVKVLQEIVLLNSLKLNAILFS